MGGGNAPDVSRGEDEEWPAWSEHIRAAWADLRDDRHFGDMGGMGRIYFRAIDRYAERFGISGTDFDDFLIFIRAMDDEFIRHMSEKQKIEAEKNRAQR